MGRIKLPDLALGSYEAACIMGVHWGRPQRMVAQERLLAKALTAAWTDEQERTTHVYSLHDCEDDYQHYLDTLSASGDAPHRPRAYLHLREDILRLLAQAEPKILFDDAIGTGDAAELLGVHPTAIQKMVEAGKLHPRRPHNGRNPASKAYIFSRAECLADRRRIAAMERAGTKPGRKRRVAQ